MVDSIPNSGTKLEGYCAAHGLDRASDAIGNYAFARDNASRFRILCQSPKRRLGWIMLAGSFPTLEAAQLASVSPMVTLAYTVSQWCRDSGWFAGSDLHNDCLVISRPSEHGRTWRVARVGADGVAIVETLAPRTRGEAIALCARLSGSYASTLALPESTPSWPFGRYAGRS